MYLNRYSHVGRTYLSSLSQSYVSRISSNHLDFVAVERSLLITYSQLRVHVFLLTAGMFVCDNKDRCYELFLTVSLPLSMVCVWGGALFQVTLLLHFFIV